MCECMVAKQRRCPKCGSFNVTPTPSGIICNECRHFGAAKEVLPELMQERPKPALPEKKPERKLEPKKLEKKKPIEFI